ncbi:protein-glutamate O-methyltransferase CheR [Lutibacter sp. B2]|nr:protein-glutamate O-methyltransferase CheR [Lutibacter sp. B2]
MSPKLSSNEFTLMKKYIEEKCGISLGEEKAYLIESRLSRLLISSGLSSFSEFYSKIIKQDDKHMTEKIIDAITTNETSWFRDKIPWIILEEVLLPKYINQIRNGEKSKIRIWCAACSTGQEPYSIIMCIDHFLNKNGIKDITLDDFEILATDISSTVLQIAKMGRYDSISIMRGLDQTYKNKYFESQGRVWLIDEKIKNAVRFKAFNLQNSFLLLGKFDIVFCRYVMIYFSKEFKEEIVRKIAYALEDEGLLFIGSSELLNNKDDYFEKNYYQNSPYYRKR